MTSSHSPELISWLENPKSGVVDEEIQPAKFPNKGLHGRFDHPLIGYVTGKNTDLGGTLPQAEGLQFLQFGFVAGQQPEMVLLCG